MRGIGIRSKPRKIKPNKLRKELEKLQKEITIRKYGRDCYTCPAKALQKSNCQLGHVPWPRSVLSVECKFSTDYTRIQCYMCNIWRGGMGAVAYKRMQGEGVDLELLWQRNEANKGKTFGPKQLQEKIDQYRALLTEI